MNAAATKMPEQVEDEAKHTDMGHSGNLGEFALALSKAQGAFETAKKDSANPHYKTSYADLASVMLACRAALSVNELAIVQRPVAAPAGWVRIVSMLIHKSGQWIAGMTELPAGGTAQTYGSAITYARRYGLSCLAGIVADDDDDGNAASDGTKAQLVTQASGHKTSPRTTSNRENKVAAVPAPMPVPVAAAREPGADDVPDSIFHPVANAVPIPPGPEFQRRARAVFMAKRLPAPQFTKWVETIIGKPKKSADWTPTELDELERAVHTEAAEAKGEAPF